MQLGSSDPRFFTSSARRLERKSLTSKDPSCLRTSVSYMTLPNTNTSRARPVRTHDDEQSWTLDFKEPARRPRYERRVGGNIHAIAKHLWRAQHAAPLRLIGAIDMKVRATGTSGCRGTLVLKQRAGETPFLCQGKPELRKARPWQYSRDRQALVAGAACCAPTVDWCN